MPKRKGGRKKRGGSKGSPHFANAGNVHNPKNFGSDQGLISGCAGCVGGNIAIGSGCTLTSQAAAQESATRGISRLMNGINGRVGGIQSGGGNTGTTTFKDLQNAAQNGMGYARVPITSVTDCGVTSSTSMGAGQNANAQKGGGIGETASCVSACNNLGTPGYGLNVKGTSDLNATLIGSGYPVVSPYNTNKCGGRKTKKKRKRKSRKKRKGGWPKIPQMPKTTMFHDRTQQIDTRCNKDGAPRPGWKFVKGTGLAQGRCQHFSERASLIHDPFSAPGLALRSAREKFDPTYNRFGAANRGGKRKTRKRRKHKKRRRTKRKRKNKRRTRRKRGGDVSTLQKMTQKWQQYIGFPPQLTGGGSYKKRRNRKGGKRKTMKGGYAQFASNDPMTPGFSSPKPGPLPWATGPLSKSRQINCQDNYNHYTGKSNASPVTDGAAPVTPFGGTAK